MTNPYTQLLQRLKHSLADRNDIYLVFISGSIPKASETTFSDIDIWIIFREEAALNRTLYSLTDLVNPWVNVEHITQCTPTHFFIFSTDKLQVDLNLSTAAEYHSLLSANKKTIVDVTPHHQVNEAENQFQFYKAVKTLERTISKYLSHQLYVVPRFLTGLRDESLVPLLCTQLNISVPTLVQVELTQFPQKVAAHLIATFAQPNATSCQQGILSAVWLLEYLARHSQLGSDESKKDLKKIKRAAQQLKEVESKK